MESQYVEQVYGAITYYLAHRAEIDAYLAQADAEFEALRQRAHAADPRFARKLVESADKFDREVATLGQSEKFMQFLAERAKEPGTIPLEQLKQALDQREE